MVDLTLDDLVRWEPGRLRVVAPAADRREALAQPLSWAVTIRATAPVLPSLRGDELVVVPARLLAELREGEGIGWAQLLDHLETLPVSGVVTDEAPALAATSRLVVLEAASPFRGDVEAALNREIIERRSALYQLGSELARSLSAASIAGSDLEELLTIAARLGGVPVVLLAGSGTVLAASEHSVEAAGPPFDPERPHPRVPHAGRDWVCHPVRSAALPEGVLLSAAISEDAPGDRARLVLEQTAEALGMLFDRLPPVDAGSRRRELERLLVEIVLQGTFAPVARRRLERLAPRLDLDGDLRLAVAWDGESAFTAADDYTFPFDDTRAGLLGVERYRELRRGHAKLIVSPAVSGVPALAEVVPVVERALVLARRGLFPGGLVDLGCPEDGDALQTLLVAGFASEDVHETLATFAAAKLAPLDAYDRSRDGALVETLAAYVDAGATVAAAAETLGVHRNTLAYRIARIEEVGGYKLSDPAVRFDLQLAIAIRRALFD